MKSKSSKYLTFFVLAIAFVLSVVIRFHFTNYAKVIAVYPDELRYLGIARNIARGNGLMLHHIASDFQKILYSLMIAPVFLVPTTVHRQIQLIGLLNCIYMSLSMIPVYLLTEEIFEKNRYKKAFLVFMPVFILLMPDFAYTMTFMSEVIFMPLSLLFIYLIYKIFSTDRSDIRIGLNVAAGVLLYILYMNKEISLYFLIAYFMVLCLKMLFKEDKWKSQWLSFFVCAGVFVLFFVLLKLTLFRGMGSSYNQTSLDAILSFHNFAFMIYGFIYSLFIIGVGFFFFPIVLPALSLKKMEKEQRDLYLFVIFSLVVGAAVIAYTITVREDLDLRSPRQHLRYLMPLFIPLLMLLLNNFALIRQEIRNHKKLFMGITIVFGVLFLIFVEDIAIGSHVDQTAMKYFVYIPNWIAGVLQTSRETGTLMLRCVIAAALIGFSLILLYVKEKLSFSIFIAVLFLVNLVNNGCCVREYTQVSIIPYGQIQEVELLNEFCSETNGIIIGITGQGFTQYDRLLDTYLENDIYLTSEECIKTATHKDSVDFDFEKSLLISKFPVLIYEDVHRADYMITPTDVVLENVERVEIEGLTLFSVYKNLDPLKICLP